jgi:hypothetical protein
VHQINTIQPAYTKYESSSESGDQEVVVIEVENVDHRSAVKNEFFLQLFQEELYWMVRKEYLLQLKGEEETGDNLEALDKVWPPPIFEDNTPPSMRDDLEDEDRASAGSKKSNPTTT